MRPRRVLLLAFLLGVCALAGSGGGCGSSDAPTPATVRGRVLFRGRPLAGGMIVFAPHPDRGPAGRAAAAAIGPDGEYRLAVGGSPYIAAGWYQVAIADPPEPARITSIRASRSTPPRAATSWSETHRTSRYRWSSSG